MLASCLWGTLPQTIPRGGKPNRAVGWCKSRRIDRERPWGLKETLRVAKIVVPQCLQHAPVVPPAVRRRYPHRHHDLHVKGGNITRVVAFERDQRGGTARSMSSRQSATDRAFGGHHLGVHGRTKAQRLCLRRRNSCNCFKIQINFKRPRGRNNLGLSILKRPLFMLVLAKELCAFRTSNRTERRILRLRAQSKDALAHTLYDQSCLRGVCLRTTHTQDVKHRAC